MKRPSHAVDCPACDGWIGGAELLCRQCGDRVCKNHALLLREWIAARAQNEAHHTIESAAVEAYRRGLVVGVATVLFKQRFSTANFRKALASTSGKGARS